MDIHSTWRSVSAESTTFLALQCSPVFNTWESRLQKHWFCLPFHCFCHPKTVVLNAEAVVLHTLTLA